MNKTSSNGGVVNGDEDSFDDELHALMNPMQNPSATKKHSLPLTVVSTEAPATRSNFSSNNRMGVSRLAVAYFDGSDLNDETDAVENDLVESEDGDVMSGMCCGVLGGGCQCHLFLMFLVWFSVSVILIFFKFLCCGFQCHFFDIF